MNLFDSEPIPADQDVRDRLTSVFDQNVLVEASAGSGKTTVLVERLVQMLARGHAKVGDIAALTFTRKAAGEMRSRFYVRLDSARHASDDDRIKKRLGQALEQVHHAYIGTIHGFCARLLRDYSTEAGLPAGFEEVHEDDEADLINEVWNNWTHELHEQNDPIIAELHELGLSLIDLHDGFVRFSQYSDVAAWPCPPSSAPSLKGLREKLSEYHSHMAALAPQLPVEANDRLMEKYRRLPRLASSILWHAPQHVFKHLEEYESKQSGTVKKRWPGGTKQCEQELERWNDLCEKVVEPLMEQWRAHRYPTVIRFLIRAEQYYRLERHRRGLLTYQDLLQRSVELITANTQVRKLASTQWKRLLIDEFQDTDPLQAELLFLLTSKRAVRHWLEAEPRAGSLLMVGDPKQSIYRFRRADIQIYQLVKNRIEATGGEVVQLTTNFRSQLSLVKWINSTFEDLFAMPEPSPQVKYLAMNPGRRDDRSLDQCLQYLEFPKETAGRTKEDVSRAEADAIARYILEAIDGKLVFERSEAEKKRGVPPEAVADDFLILTAQRERLQNYGDILSSWGIPNQVSGGAQLNTFPGLRLLHLLLTSASEPDNTIALVGLLRSDLCGLSDAQLYAFHVAGGKFRWMENPPDTAPQASIVLSFYQVMQQLASDMERWPVVAALERTLDKLGMPLWSALWGETGLGCLAKALICLRNAESRTAGVQSVIRRLEKLLNREPRQDGLYLPSQAGVGVRIMNLHKAKGLESRVVILADSMGDSFNQRDATLHVSRNEGSSVGYLNVTTQSSPFTFRSLAHPANWDEYLKIENDINLAEKERLLYVAATRAQDVLVVCYRTSSDDNANRTNPWRNLIQHLGGASRIEPDSARQPELPASQKTQHTISRESARSVEAAWKACLTPHAKSKQFQAEKTNPKTRAWAQMWQSSWGR